MCRICICLLTEKWKHGCARRGSRKYLPMWKSKKKGSWDY